MTDKVQVSKITITRAEGYTHECGKPFVATSFVEANSRLWRWSESAPKDGSYDKCDFVVLYADGTEYSGRYDLKHWTEEVPDIGAHMGGFLSYLAGDAPAWMQNKPDVLKSYLAGRAAAPEEVERAKAFLSGYIFS